MAKSKGPEHKAKVKAQDVAKLAGVSISAVSRSFTAGASVAPATRAKILKAARRLGYEPNIMARSLMTGRTELVGLVSNNFDNPAFMQIFNLFTRGLQANGLRPLIVNLSDGVAPQDAVGLLRQYNVDGVIIASSSIEPRFIKDCLAAGIPLVHAFGRGSAQARYPIISADNLQGGRLAAETLLNHGYRRIGFLGGPETASSTFSRLKGFREKLAEAGVSPGPVVFAETYSHDEGSRLMRQILMQQRPEAVFCGDDILAIGAVDACVQAGLAVPDDMGLLGFNDMSMAAWPSYDLSTIRQPIAEIIVESVQRILELIAKPEITTNHAMHACAVVLRGSLKQRALG